MEALDLRKEHARNIPCRLFYMHPLSDLNACDVKEHNGNETSPQNVREVSDNLINLFRHYSLRLCWEKLAQFCSYYINNYISYSRNAAVPPIRHFKRVPYVLARRFM